MGEEEGGGGERERSGECRKTGVGVRDDPKKWMGGGERRRIKTNEGRQTTAERKNQNQL